MKKSEVNNRHSSEESTLEVSFKLSNKITHMVGGKNNYDIIFTTFVSRSLIFVCDYHSNCYLLNTNEMNIWGEEREVKITDLTSTEFKMDRKIMDETFLLKKNNKN